jgi:glucokinase
MVLSCCPEVATRGDARLLADIGGTNARFAWRSGAGAPIADVMSLPCAGYARLADAIRHYLLILDRQAPAYCAIAIANPVRGDLVRMTNHHWAFSIRALKEEFGFAGLRVLNDFTALAMALPVLGSAELRQVRGAQAVASAAIGLIGPGTGLGVSGLLPDGRGGWIPIEGEGGHATLAACSPREQAVLQWLSSRYGHVSAERAVCGQGLADIHRAVQQIDGAKALVELNAAGVVSAALEREDPQALEALDLFCAFLGTVAGNLALTLGAYGGIYIGGGIVPRLGDAFRRSSFGQRFESKGRFAQGLAEIPVYVIKAAQSPALCGAAIALESMREEALAGMAGAL